MQLDLGSYLTVVAPPPSPSCLQPLRPPFPVLPLRECTQDIPSAGTPCILSHPLVELPFGLQDGHVDPRSVSEAILPAAGFDLFLSLDRLCLQLWPYVHWRGVQCLSVWDHAHPDVPVLQDVRRVSVFSLVDLLESRRLMEWGVVTVHG